MARIVEYLNGEQLAAGVVAGDEKKKLLLTDARGRSIRLAPDKVVFSHDAASLEAFALRRDALAAEVDVELLWETVSADAPGQDLSAADLAQTYFDDASPAHCSAMFVTLVADRERFRRRGLAFQPRSAEDLAQLQRQRGAEQERQDEEAALTRALANTPVEPALCARLERWLRTADDKVLANVLAPLAQDPAQHAFELLLAAGHLPPTADLPVLRANLRAEHPAAAIAYAEDLAAAPPGLPGDVVEAAFSIDDPETREVDDVLTFAAEGDELRVDIDIADVAALVRMGDPVDREAQRRASTAYLPTGTYYMLPERVGCDLASLHSGALRPAMRTTAWFHRDGRLLRHALSRVTLRVAQRLDYDAADALLRTGNGATAEALRLLDELAGTLRAARREAGAVSFPRPEWKIRVAADGAEVHVTPLPPDSPSRQLVAELMILTNRLAAERAAEAGLPMIYRVQPPPTGPVPKVAPDDPAAFAKLRGVMQPANLSLEPGWHWGLGLRAYTQVTSPLRRYADLVAQRQLTALMADEVPPYDADELLKVLANAEAVERELKTVEALVTERWALEAVARLPQQTALPGWVVSEAAGGYKVMLAVSGAVGLLTTKHPLNVGAAVEVDVQRVVPRRAILRLQLRS